MNLGRFYFLSPQYFLDFPNQNLMSNHSEHNNKPHNRPCSMHLQMITLFTG